MAWWPFKRRAVPTPPETPPSPAAGGDSAEDWAVGDLAECIDDTWFFRTAFGWAKTEHAPTLGQIERVAVVRIINGRQFLQFKRYGDRQGYAATQFRKITPKADATERADADFIAAIRPKVAQ